MDFSTIAVNSPFVAVLTFAAVNLVKAVPGLPIFKGQTGRVRATAGVLAFLSAILLGIADGNLEEVLTADHLSTGVVFALGWLGSHGGWKVWKWFGK